MQYDDIEVRQRETSGQRMVEIDGYHHVQPESKFGEYRRVPLVDLSEAQVRELYGRLGDCIAEWDE